MLDELQNQLASITGFAACNLQPTSGAAGEYTGLVTIREYLHRKGQDNRTVLFNPAVAPRVALSMRGNYSGTKYVFFHIDPKDITD